MELDFKLGLSQKLKILQKESQRLDRLLPV